jgi:hypothetical protein
MVGWSLPMMIADPNLMMTGGWKRWAIAGWLSKATVDRRLKPCFHFC